MNGKCGILTDEQIRELDVVPQVLPDLLLRGTRDVHKITPDLNVRAVDDGELRPDFLDERDEARHLRVV